MSQASANAVDFGLPRETAIPDIAPDVAGLFARSVAWARSFVMWWSVGIAIGLTIDHALWLISFNYIYSPHEIVRRFAWHSFSAAAVIAAAATSGRRYPAQTLPLGFKALQCGVLTLALSILWGSAAAWATAPETSTTVSLHLAPLRRVHFCGGLIHGAEVGFGIGTAAATIRLLFR